MKPRSDHLPTKDVISLLEKLSMAFATDKKLGMELLDECLSNLRSGEKVLIPGPFGHNAGKWVDPISGKFVRWASKTEVECFMTELNRKIFDL